MERNQQRARRGVAPRLALAALFATTYLTGPITFTPAMAQEVSAGNYSIPPQPLSSALVAFGQKSGLQIFFDERITAGLRSPAISGPLTNEAALDRLLSGTGLDYRFTNARTVSIVAPSSTAGATADDGTVMLGTIVIGGGIGSDFSRSDDYMAAASVSSVDRETLDRSAQTSPGEILKGIPGVTVGDIRNGGAFQPNIRGVQGMGRVKVVIDGTETSPSAYKGYGGNVDHNFVDTDFLAGLRVEKGVVTNGSGGIGGQVVMRTMDADDIIKNGKTWGIRTRLTYGNNFSDGSEAVGTCLYISPSWSPNRTCSNNTSAANTYLVTDDYFEGVPDKRYSFSSIAAWRPTERLELVAGLSHRESGNYSAGGSGTNPFSYRNPGSAVYDKGYSLYYPGDLVFGTYNVTTSRLLKVRYDLTADSKIAFGFSHMDSRYVDRKESDPQNHTTIPGTAIGVEAAYLYPGMGSSDQKRYNLAYELNPADTPWLNLKAELWYADTLEYRPSSFLDFRTETTGLRLTNQSEISLPSATARLETGFQATHEVASQNFVPLTARQTQVSNLWEVTGAEQTEYSLWANTFVPVNDWFAVEAGLRHAWYKVERDPAALLGTNHAADFTETSGDGTSYNLGLIADVAEGVQLYGRYAKGWRAPTMRENTLGRRNMDYAAWIAAGQPVTPLIRPEQSRNIELGVNILRDGLLSEQDHLGVKFSYYDTKYTDYVFGNGYWPVFSNIDAVKFRGLELALDYRSGWFYARYSGAKSLERSACGYDALNGVSANKSCHELSSSEGATSGLTSPPDWQHSLTLGARWLEDRLDTGLTVTHLRGVGPVERGQAWNSGNYTTVDLFANYKLNESISLDLTVTNVADKYYFDANHTQSTALPAPGRTVTLGLTSHF